jgi:hypothetical protein
VVGGTGRRGKESRGVSSLATRGQRPPGNGPKLADAHSAQAAVAGEESKSGELTGGAPATVWVVQSKI